MIITYRYFNIWSRNEDYSTQHEMMIPVIYHIAGKFGRGGKFGEFGELSVICHIKTIQLSTYD